MSRSSLVLLVAFLLAVGCAATFSGSVIAPLTAVPIAIIGGSIAGELYLRDLS